MQGIEITRKNRADYDDVYEISIVTSMELGSVEYKTVVDAMDEISKVFDAHINRIKEDKKKSVKEKK